MKGSIKARTVDKYLRPIRNQIKDLIKPKSSVIEYGCGNGDLLFTLSDKIKSGIGLDISQSLINYAINYQTTHNLSNIEFRKIDVNSDNTPETQTDYSVASLLFHVLPWENAQELLKHMTKFSQTSIICGFSEPQTALQGFQLWIDQRFTRHYRNFKVYKENGFTEGLISSMENINCEKFDTFDPVIKVYKITL